MTPGSAAVPADCGATRGRHFGELLGSGGTVVTVAIAAVVAFAIGASQHSLAVMVGGPLVVALAAVAICWYRADRAAEDEFFKRFAAAHQMTHAPRWQLYELTPLLGAGDRRSCKHWMDNKAEGIGWYTFEVKQDHDDNRDTYTSYEFTIATIDVGELGMSRFHGVYQRRRRGLFDRLSSDADWLGRHHLKKVELESTAYCEKYELWAEQEQDDVVVRQFFSPKFVLWMTEHPLAPGFELRAGTLVVFLPGHCEEAGKLEWLLMAARDIAKRIQLELTEAAQAGSL